MNEQLLPKRLSILLVEDSADDETLTVRALKRNNIADEVIVARDGDEALVYLFDPGLEVLPRVVLLDWKLPRMDGQEVLRRVRAHPRTPLLPVVILTTSSEQEDMVRAYSGGANSYVRKPVDVRQFNDAVRQLGAYWLAVNEPVLA